MQRRYLLSLPTIAGLSAAFAAWPLSDKAAEQVLTGNALPEKEMMERYLAIDLSIKFAHAAYEACDHTPDPETFSKSVREGVRPFIKALRGEIV